MTLIPEIDTFACVAHGDCAVVAPQAFRVDDVAVVTGTAPDDVLLEAARACPAGAIVLVDSETGEEVDPGSPWSERQRRLGRSGFGRARHLVFSSWTDVWTSIPTAHVRPPPPTLRPGTSRRRRSAAARRRTPRRDATVSGAAATGPSPAIPPPSTKPATAAPMRTCFLCATSWPRQSVTTATSWPQLLDGHAELGAVGLDRAADLLGGAGRHQRGTSPAPRCPGGAAGSLRRSRGSAGPPRWPCTGLGGVAFLMKRNASKPPSAPSRNRISVTIRKPSHGAVAGAEDLPDAPRGGVQQVDQAEQREDRGDRAGDDAADQLLDLLRHLGLRERDLLAHEELDLLGDLLDGLAEL